MCSKIIVNFADVVSQGKVRKVRVFMGDSICRKEDRVEIRGDDITVWLSVAKIEDAAEKARQVMGGGTGGAVHVHVGKNNAIENSKEYRCTSKEMFTNYLGKRT